MKLLWRRLQEAVLGKTFVDTNIFVYFLFPTDEKKYRACALLFEKARGGGIRLWTTEWVIAELIWITVRLKVDWNETKEVIISGILNSKGLEVRKRKLVADIVEAVTDGSEFVDRLNLALAQAEGIRKGYSFDKGLDKWKGFKRLEPR